MAIIVSELVQIGTVIDVDGDESTIEIFPEFADGLYNIEQKEFLDILFWIPLSRDTLIVHPRGDPANPRRGVFSTRSPVRPNNIGVTTVRLIGRKGNLIKVKGLDAFKDTAVVDIKEGWRREDGTGHNKGMR